MGENSTSPQYFLALATMEMAWSMTSSRFLRSWCMMWMSEVERNTWMRGGLGPFKGLPRLVHVVGHCPGQGGDDGAPHLPDDGLNRLEVPWRAGGEACLDYVHVETGELPGYDQLLFPGHADARGLLSVPAA